MVESLSPHECERRAQRLGPDDPAEQAWWQEVIGALIAR
jgi:hypothetical protein